MESTGIVPGFNSVDGAGCGIGAAPLAFTDSLGMPLYDPLAFVKRTLKRCGFSDDVKVIATGKIVTAFDILKAMPLGASACCAPEA